MGTLLKWKPIDTEATYTHARIHRSASQSGTYTQIHSQLISDTSYYDPDGTTNSWYKVDFYDSTTGDVSSLSDPIQGGTWAGYCTIKDIRDLTNLTTSDINDSGICNIIEVAGRQLNSDINKYWYKEEIDYIDETKENDINGTNKIFYTINFPIGDGDDDMHIETDDITVYERETDGTETEATVSSITANEGKFVLSSAPASSLRLYVTYNSVQRSVSDPHPLVRTACVMLTAAYCYSKLNIGKSPQFKLGTITIKRDTNAFDFYYNKYLRILTAINDRSITDIKEATDLI